MNAPVLLTPRAPKKKWLAYVVDVFTDVTGIPLRILEAGSDVPEGTATIFYAAEPTSQHKGIYIPEFELEATDPETSIQFSGDIFRGTLIDGSEVSLHHAPSSGFPKEAAVRTPSGIVFGGDFFRNAFLRLSCAGERLLERRDGPHHGYCPDSLRNASYLKPIVNYLFEALKIALTSMDPRLAETPRAKKTSVLLLTHDVDAVHKTFLKASKQSVMHLTKLPRSMRRHGMKQAMGRLKSALTLPFSPDDFDRIDSWRTWDHAAGAETAYYVYAKTPARSCAEKASAFVFDPDYDLSRNPRLAQRFKALRQSGAVVGLHGSFGSYDDAERLAAEKQALERAVDAPVDQIRQHWLRFRFDATWRAQTEAGFKVDTGFGFNNVPGFRSWLCHPHRPWDDKRQTAHDLTVIPMAAMDSTLFDYLDLSPPQILETLETLALETKKFGGRVCFNWHTHGASRHLRWDEIYRSFLSLP